MFPLFKYAVDTAKFQRNTSPPSSGLEIAGCYLLHLVFCLAYTTLKMEAKYSFGTSVDLQRTTRPYIPEDRSLIITAVRTSNHIGILYCVGL
jgi:hypothetical protein